ncbi:hypothetical protein HCN44_000003 [Aphidius gifuensis]|uniref:Uncharacterized protein n=1 Tax=Aphidius gifuensis TaxID=684658 RepID=A0A835CQH2_APHGI|nr:hypothetical protein HCN44_000003 [Aphidius gifuensis]
MSRLWTRQSKLFESSIKGQINNCQIKITQLKIIHSFCGWHHLRDRQGQPNNFVVVIWRRHYSRKAEFFPREIAKKKASKCSTPWRSFTLTASAEGFPPCFHQQHYTWLHYNVSTVLKYISLNLIIN